MRLTKKRADNGRYYLSGLAEVLNIYPKGYGRIQVGHAVDKLAEYEELEEQCIQENSWGLRMLLHKWKEFIEDIQKLYNYRKLEEQGRLLKLPCVVGDTVFEIYKGEIIERIVRGILFRGGELWGQDGNGSNFGIFGKTVFLTKEDAESALKEMGE